MKLVRDNNGDILYTTKNYKYSSRSGKKHRQDSTKTYNSKYQKKTYKYSQKESYKNKIYDADNFIEEESQEMQEVNRELKKCLKKDTPINVFIQVLLDWGRSHSFQPIDQFYEFFYEHLAIKLIEMGIDLNTPVIIQELYTRMREFLGEWYYPLQELKFLIKYGADPSKLLENLWEAEPLLGSNNLFYRESEISILVDSGAIVNNPKFLMKYICNPWEHHLKTYRGILDPLVDDMFQEDIELSLNYMFNNDRDESDYFLLEYMILKGLDPNIQNGKALKRIITDYIFYIGLANGLVEYIFDDTKSYDPIELWRDIHTGYEEDSLYKLNWMTLCIMIKYCSFRNILNAYSYVDTIMPFHCEWGVLVKCSQEYRDNVKSVIEYLRPCVIYKRQWAALVIQRAWRKAISNPKYTMCVKRLNMEFEILSK